VANIHAGAELGAASINHSHDIDVANIAAHSRENVAETKANAPGKAPKTPNISAATGKMIAQQVDSHLSAMGATDITAAARQKLIDDAMSNYQQSKNPGTAAKSAIDGALASGRSKRGAGGSAAPAVPQGYAPPKQAPDGNWYTTDPRRPGKFLKVG
jgi:hypothetical protein